MSSCRFHSALTAVLMEGRLLADRIRAEVAEEVRELGEIGLATVQVGEDPASSIYLRRKHEAASEAGIRSVDRKFPAEISEDELLTRSEERRVGKECRSRGAPYH